MKASVQLAMIYVQQFWEEDKHYFSKLGITYEDVMQRCLRKAVTTYWISEKDAKRELERYKSSLSRA